MVVGEVLHLGAEVFWSDIEGAVIPGFGRGFIGDMVIHEHVDADTGAVFGLTLCGREGGGGRRRRWLWRAKRSRSWGGDGRRRRWLWRAKGDKRVGESTGGNKTRN